jgi:putative transposase
VQTYYCWRKKYGGIEVSGVRYMRQLEKENSQLKRLLAERELSIAALKTLLRKKPACRSERRGRPS